MPVKRHDYILLIAAAVLLIMAVMQRVNIKKFTIQNFTGSPVKEVENWMSAESVPDKNVVFNRVFSETVAEGTVISQSIEPGRTVSGNNSIVVTVSKGADPNYRITLADFSEMDQSSIEKWLEDNRIESYQFVYAINENKTEGLFLSSTPAAGTRIKRNESVTVTMCMHDHSTTVIFPDFTGQTVNEIQEWADENEITVSFIYYYDESANGTFMFSDISAGTEIEKGTSLSIAVSAGPGA